MAESVRLQHQQASPENNTNVREMASSYHENGFLVCENLYSPDEINELRDETVRLCRNEGGLIGGVEAAKPDEDDMAVLQRILCVHFPHKLSEMMMRYMKHEKIVQVLTQIIGPDVKAMQSMLFIKAAGKPGQAWHQDEYYIPTRDRSLTGVWIALDDAHTENGCLWMIPGSHRRSILWPQKWHDNREFDCSSESYNFPYTDDQAVPVEIKAGGVAFFNGYTLHRSLPNRATSGFRRALVNHYMSADSLLPWRPGKAGESIATTDYRDIVMVAGQDPYEWKGTEEIAHAHVRPAGDGGCESWGGNKYTK